MAKGKRDYKAEYARRNALAKSRGFKNYADQRRKIETGLTAPIAPTRIRARRTVEAQDARSRAGAFGWDSDASKDVLEFRLEMAQRWSDSWARTNVLKFDSKRARVDSEYMNAYMQAFVMDFTPDVYGYARLSRNEWVRHYLVDVMEYYTADEYEARYGAKD